MSLTQYTYELNEGIQYKHVIRLKGVVMGWIVAFLIVAVGIAALVGGTVLHPVLYELFIAAVLIVPLFLGSSAINTIIDSIFGRRK